MIVSCFINNKRNIVGYFHRINSKEREVFKGKLVEIEDRAETEQGRINDLHKNCHRIVWCLYFLFFTSIILNWIRSKYIKLKSKGKRKFAMMVNQAGEEVLKFDVDSCFKIEDWKFIGDLPVKDRIKNFMILLNA